MTLAELLCRLPDTGTDGLAFPRSLLGAFRRKSITFCNGLTDEATIVYWFQSRGFTIDLRLSDEAATPVVARQGWVGDTLWDAERQELSWSIARSYQPRNQWPEPASLRFIGDSVLEFAPSGAYVEDWRQQSLQGPLLGLRLLAMIDAETDREIQMDGGLIVAGRHLAFCQSRRPELDEAFQTCTSLEEVLAKGVATEAEIESYEVSIAIDGEAITLSTCPALIGEAIALGDFTLRPDGAIVLSRVIEGKANTLLFALDLYVPDFRFDRQTLATADAMQWIDRERDHLLRHAEGGA